MIDTTDAARRFHDAGYLILEQFFDEDLTDELDAAITAHYGATPARFHEDEFVDQAEVDVVPWFPQRDGPSPFDRVDADPRLRAITTAVLGDGWSADYCMVMHSAPKSAGQAWHQDCPPEDPAVFNLNRLLYTRTVHPGNGGQLVVVPGSHRLGELPVGDPHAPLDGEVVITPSRGTVALVHGQTWHRVTPIGPRARTSVNHRAVPVGTPPDITDVCVYRNLRYRFSTNEIIAYRPESPANS